MKKKALSLILALLMVASSFASCAESTSDDETSASADDTQSQTAEEEVVEAETEVTRENYPDNLPEKDWEGRNYNLFTREGYEDSFQPSDLTGEVLNDAIYQRNVKIAERYNIDITYYSEYSAWGNASWNNTLINSVMAQDGAYDCVAGYAAYVTEVVPQNILLNWLEVPYIDVSQPWWSQRASDALTVNGKQFLLTGDYSVSLWDNMFGFFFNKTLQSNFGIEDLYQVVKDKKWTLDYLTTTAEKVSMDYDGNGTMDVNDMYGLVSNYSTAIDTFQIGAEMAVVSHTDSGSLEITLNSERAVSIVEKVVYLYNDSKAGYSSYEDETLFDEMFTTDRALFYATYFVKMSGLRDMESDFGVLPYPMLDEEQGEYANTSRDNFDLFVLPVDVKDQEFSGMIIEALCAESWRSVIPEYYDVVLKVKTSRDVESAEMIDIIRDTLTFDFGYLCSSALNGIGHIFVNLVRDNSTDLASRFKSNEKAANKMLEKMLASYGIE